MAQLISVRSNQDFGLDYKKGRLVPQTEIIILVEKPHYIVNGDDITRTARCSELRFKTGTAGISALIEMLKGAEKTAAHYEQLAGAINEVINTNPMPPEGTLVEDHGSPIEETKCIFMPKLNSTDGLCEHCGKKEEDHG